MVRGLYHCRSGGIGADSSVTFKSVILMFSRAMPSSGWTRRPGMVVFAGDGWSAANIAVAAAGTVPSSDLLDIFCMVALQAAKAADY